MTGYTHYTVRFHDVWYVLIFWGRGCFALGAFYQMPPDWWYIIKLYVLNFWRTLNLQDIHHYFLPHFISLCCHSVCLGMHFVVFTVLRKMIFHIHLSEFYLQFLYFCTLVSFFLISRLSWNYFIYYPLHPLIDTEPSFSFVTWFSLYKKTGSIFSFKIFLSIITHWKLNLFHTVAHSHIPIFTTKPHSQTSQPNLTAKPHNQSSQPNLTNSQIV